MASAKFHYALGEILKANIDLDAAGNQVDARMVMTNTTADTEVDADTILDITTLDEADATGYSAQTLANKAVNDDEANNRAEFDADNVSFSGLSGDATRDYQGVVIVDYVDGGTGDIPIIFVEPSNQPLAKEATQVDFPWDAEGIFQIS